MSTAPNPAVIPASSGAGGSPASGAGPPPASGVGAPPAGAGPGAPADSEGLRNLRSSYDELKKAHDPWEKLGIKPDDVTRFKTTSDTFFTRVSELAKALNYEEEEVREEFFNDPYGTLQYLEQEAAKTSREQDPNAKLKSDLDKRLSPIEKELQQRKAKEVSARFDGEFDRLFAEEFKEAKFDKPTEVNLLYDTAAQLMKLDREAIGRLREGKVSDVAKFFNEAKGLLDAYFLARTSRESGVITEGPGKGPKSGEGGKRKFNLDDIANDPGVLGPQYAE